MHRVRSRETRTAEKTEHQAHTQQTTITTRANNKVYGTQVTHKEPDPSLIPPQPFTRT